MFKLRSHKYEFEKICLKVDFFMVFLHYFVYICNISTHLACVFIERKFAIKNRYKNDVKDTHKIKRTPEFLKPKNVDSITS